MEPVTRRSFLVAGSAGALGVAGAAAVGAPLTVVRVAGGRVTEVDLRRR